MNFHSALTQPVMLSVKPRSFIIILLVSNTLVETEQIKLLYMLPSVFTVLCAGSFFLMIFLNSVKVLLLELTPFDFP